MKADLTFQRIFVAAAGFGAALSLSGIAQAITDTSFRYSTEQTGYFSISPMAMAPNDDTAANNFAINRNAGAGVQTDGFICMDTGVNLPHVAIMTELSVWTTSGAANNPALVLYRHRLTDGARDTLAFIMIADDSGMRKKNDMAIPEATAKVSNALYTYGFGLCLGAGDTFHGARVTYTYNRPGD